MRVSGIDLEALLRQRQEREVFPWDRDDLPGGLPASLAVSLTDLAQCFRLAESAYRATFLGTMAGRDTNLVLKLGAAFYLRLFRGLVQDRGLPRCIQSIRDVLTSEETNWLAQDSALWQALRQLPWGVGRALDFTAGGLYVAVKSGADPKLLYYDKRGVPCYGSFAQTRQDSYVAACPITLDRLLQTPGWQTKVVNYELSGMPEPPRGAEYEAYIEVCETPDPDWMAKQGRLVLEPYSALVDTPPPQPGGILVDGNRRLQLLEAPRFEEDGPEPRPKPKPRPKTEIEKRVADIEVLNLEGLEED